MTRTTYFLGNKIDLLALGMVDYQCFPDMDDPVAKLRMAMANMDGKTSSHFFVLATQSYGSVETLCSYSMSRGPPANSAAIIPEPDSNLDPQLLQSSSVSLPPRGLRIFPPPLFSRQTIPQGYKFVPFFRRLMLWRVTIK